MEDMACWYSLEMSSNEEFKYEIVILIQLRVQVLIVWARVCGPGRESVNGYNSFQLYQIFKIHIYFVSPTNVLYDKL